MKKFKLKTEYGHIFVNDSGAKGPVCMMLHGNSQSSNEFKEQFAAFGDKYRLIAWDLPGHGESDRLEEPTLYNIETYAHIGYLIIKSLSIQSIALFGWSLGGHIAIEMIKKWQQDNICVQGLMMTGTPPCELTKQGLAQAFKSDDGIARLVATEQWTHKDAELWVTYSGLDPMQYPDAVNTALNTDGRSRTHMLKHLSSRGDNQLIDIGKFDGPVEIVIGGKDQHINNEYIRSSVTKLQIFSRFIEMPEAGHSPFIEQADEFNKHFDTFMSKLNK